MLPIINGDGFNVQLQTTNNYQLINIYNLRIDIYQSNFITYYKYKKGCQMTSPPI